MTPYQHHHIKPSYSPPFCGRGWGFFLLFLLLLALPCSAKRKRVQQPLRMALSEAQHRRHDYYFGEATKQQLLGNYSAAHDLYLYCLGIDSTSAEAMAGLAALNAALRRDSTAHAYYKRAARLEPDNPTYQERLAVFYANSGRMDFAVPALERLLSLQPKRTAVLRALLDYHTEQGNYKEAHRLIDRLELLEGRSLDISLERCGIYEAQERPDDAVKELETLAKEQPHDPNTMMVLAMKRMERGEMSEALEWLERVRSIAPDHEGLPRTFIEYHENNGQPERAAALRDSLLYRPETSERTRYYLTLKYLQSVDSLPDKHERMLHMLDSIVAVAPTAESHQLRLAYLRSKNASPDTLETCYRDLLRLDPTNTSATAYLLPRYFQRNAYAEVEDICRMGYNAEPENLFYSYYLSIVLSQMKRNDEALEALRNGLQQVDEDTNPSVVADFYEIMGNVYYEMGRPEEAFAAYDSCLVYNGDNAGCLNNYAYYLSLRNEQLDKADRMSYRAIKLEPLNKTYLDTYAWVLYMKENYSMAKFYIDRVISPTAKDEDILTNEEYSSDVVLHAADIYDKCNLPEQAARYRSLAQQKEQ